MEFTHLLIKCMTDCSFVSVRYGGPKHLELSPWARTRGGLQAAVVSHADGRPHHPGLHGQWVPSFQSAGALWFPQSCDSPRWRWGRLLIPLTAFNSASSALPLGRQMLARGLSAPVSGLQKLTAVHFDTRQCGEDSATADYHKNIYIKWLWMLSWNRLKKDWIAES